MYAKEIRQYLDSDQSNLGDVYYNSRLKEFVDQRFGRVCINMNKPGSLKNQDVLIEWLQTTRLEAIGRNGVMLASTSSVSKTTILGSASQLAGHAS